MCRKLTTEEFINRSKEIHKNEDFDYSLVNYTGARDKVLIKCNTCGITFKIAPHHFLEGNGCKNCTRIKLTSTTEEFVKKSKAKFGDHYDYSKVNYVNSKTKVELTCNKHHLSFMVSPNEHLASNIGCCPKCAREKTVAARSVSREEFIKRSIAIHGDKYNYDKVVYKNPNSKVLIYCRKCNRYFTQEARHHMAGSGCQRCNGTERLTNEVFLERATERFGDKFDYSKVNIVNSDTKIIIGCKKHGFFSQLPGEHLKSNGCPMCSFSNGEKEVAELLKFNNIEFEPQKKFIGCSYKGNLRFDFYLPQYNLCIEYDGIQHYEVVKYFGGQKGFNKRHKKDLIKNEYCYNNDIVLLRIRYDQDIYTEINKYIEVKKYE